MDGIKEISTILSKLNSEEEIMAFFDEIFSPSEIKTLSKRWRILKMLFSGATQREIAKELNVSLCKVTRGAKILKQQNAVCAKYMTKEKK